MKLLVKMKWVEDKNEWHMQTVNDKRLAELPDCGNIDGAFDHQLDKNKQIAFTVDIRRLSDGS